MVSFLVQLHWWLGVRMYLFLRTGEPIKELRLRYGNFTRYSVPRMYNEGYIPRHDGSVLYISAKEIIDSDPDITCGRISNNVSSSGLANGTCDTNPPAAASVLRSAEFRLCRSVNNLPDPCGGWSAKSYR